MKPVTVWSMLEECVAQLNEPFRRTDIVDWFRRRHPEVKDSTLGAHIQAAIETPASRSGDYQSRTSRRPLLRRIEHGLYVRVSGTVVPDQAKPAADELPIATAGGADLILVGCVQTKRPVASPASELFDSPLFAGRRSHALRTGGPWYILSAKYGLLAPDDVIGPYDVYLADQSSGYRRAWGEFVVAQLDCLEPSLHGRTVEVHAGAAYVDPLRQPLAARGAAITTPMAHLGLGQQLAWYARARPTHASATSADSGSRAPEPALAGEGDGAGLTRALSDRAQALSPEALMNRGDGPLQKPGLYSWWVDALGAAELSAGLGVAIPPGLIYAGQAGATRWPSGKRSGNTLWSRIVGMHLGGSAEFSTFRRSLAAILRPILGLHSEDDPRLSAWIDAHLRVIAVPVDDADRLGEIESVVLAALDPPLNLLGRQPTAIRRRLSDLRRQRSVTLPAGLPIPGSEKPPA